VELKLKRLTLWGSSYVDNPLLSFYAVAEDFTFIGGENMDSSHIRLYHSNDGYRKNASVSSRALLPYGPPYWKLRSVG
jgi:hypothetical protein